MQESVMLPAKKEVLNTSDFVSVFDPQKISDSIYEEVNFVASIFDMGQQISREEADITAKKVEKHILNLNGDLRNLSGPLIREMACGELKGRNRDFYTRVGLSIADAFKIDNAVSDITHDNANQTKNAETKHKQKADMVARGQALLTIPQHLAHSHIIGDIHIHDLEYFTTRTFCMDWDLRFFFYYGLDPDCTGKTNIATAAMQPTVALLHAAKILGSAQTNFAGGQGFYNFLTFIAPYLEGLPYKEIKQLMQMFVFEISQTMVARGAQVVFSSIQIAPGVPKLWKDKPAVFKGVLWNGENGNEYRPYADFEREVRLAFRALMEVMTKGDAWGKLFNFPKPEVAFEKEFIIDHQEDDFYKVREELKSDPENERDVPMTYSELYELVIALTIKFGTPYYDNMIPKYRQTEGISCYQCCAYSFNVGADSKGFDDKMYFRNGEHFSMGSNQVVSTNMPRAAYKVPKGDFDALEEECERLIMEAIEVHEFKRDWIAKLWYNGHIPFATQRLRHPITKEVSPPAVDYEELVYTIGVIGMNEVALYHTGGGLDTQEGLFLNVRLLNHLTDFVHKQSEKRGIKLVLARTPAESASQRFAVSDLIAFPEEAKHCVQGDIETAIADLKTSKNLPIYYSNGTHLPVDTHVGILDRMDREGKFFQILDGGNIFHIWMGEEDPSPAALKEFIFNILKETNIGYFAFTKDFSICEACANQMNGIQVKCTKCDSEDVKAYSRITGYIQDISGWNAAKRQELKERRRLQGI
ncbi:anaerobic ribonucleoside-triphosphate reductase [Candidatus Dependentiae bacterium]|nr:anaerobic ribonucleoside-triphosphate reductase [Candidatus Dependentiae bacterium]